jgi:hypothetical protein
LVTADLIAATILVQVGIVTEGSNAFVAALSFHQARHSGSGTKKPRHF